MSVVLPTPVLFPPRPSQLGEPAWEVTTLFPKQGQWTEEDYLALNTNHLVELVNGCLEFLPMPTLFHQLIVGFLFNRLQTVVEARASGFALTAPLPVRLWPGQFREPDVIYFRPGRITSGHEPPNGADLAMEVVSPGYESRKRDLQIKREEYARAQIAEYWIVDPEEQSITVLTLAGQTYQEHGVFRAGEQASSVLLPGFTVSVADVFAAGQAIP